VARFERNPTITAKIYGTARRIGGPLDVNVYAKAANGRNVANAVRHIKRDDHTELFWNVMLSVRCGQYLAWLKREAIWKGYGL
jgi:hypothetical protein